MREWIAKLLVKNLRSFPSKDTIGFLWLCVPRIEVCQEVLEYRPGAARRGIQHSRQATDDRKEDLRYGQIAAYVRWCTWLR